MSKPELTIIFGGKVDLVETPEREDFGCWSCKAPCVIYPKARPAAVQHSLPECDEWKKIVAGKEDLERFAIKCGIELLLPKGDA